MSEQAVELPAALAAILAEPGWSPGTFGDAYRAVGDFRVYVYPGVDLAGVHGWEVVVSYRKRGEVVIADLHSVSDLLRRIEAALAQEVRS